jgi:hypothetical protein
MKDKIQNPYTFLLYLNKYKYKINTKRKRASLSFDMGEQPKVSINFLLYFVFCGILLLLMTF